MIISPWLLLRMRNVSGANCIENQKTHFMFNNFFLKTVPLRRLWLKVCLNQTGYRWQCGTCAWHEGQLMLRTHTRNMYYNYCLSTATMVRRTCPSVTLTLHCLFWRILWSFYFCFLAYWHGCCLSNSTDYELKDSLLRILFSGGLVIFFNPSHKINLVSFHSGAVEIPFFWDRCHVTR